MSKVTNEAIWDLLNRKLGDSISFEVFCDEMRRQFRPSGVPQPIVIGEASDECDDVVLDVLGVRIGQWPWPSEEGNALMRLVNENPEFEPA